MENGGNLHSQYHDSAVAQGQAQAGPSKRILLVDDELYIRQVNAELLSRFGYQTDTAEDGAAAWDALQAKKYDLLVTDNNMPRVSGLELVTMVRSAQMTLAVILVSGALPINELSRYPWLQLNATLLKPFTIDELLRTVEGALRATGSAREESEPLPLWQSKQTVDRLYLR